MPFVRPLSSTDTIPDEIDDVMGGEVAKVSGLKLSRGTINLTSTHLEAGHSKAVLIVYDDPNPLINRTSGSFFNTIKANPMGTSTPLEIRPLLQERQQPTLGPGSSHLF